MIRVHLGQNWPNFAVDVFVVMTGESDQPTHIMRYTGDLESFLWEEIEPGLQHKPTLTLDEGTARGLRDALNAHYSGVDDQRALRHDYDDERKRVDKLTDAVIGVAGTLAGQAGTGDHILRCVHTDHTGRPCSAYQVRDGE